MFQLALVQMNVVGGDREGNVNRAERLIAQAAREGAQVALLPESMDLGWTHPSALTDAEPIPDGETCRRLSEAARREGIYVCSGLIERDGDEVYNAAVLIDPKGEVLLKHRKLNELTIGHGYYAQGDRLGVCVTDFGTVGPMICADGFAKDHVVHRALGYMGADVILSPSAWAVDADHDNEKNPYGGDWVGHYAPVAREFSMWIASVSNVGPMSAGPWQGRICIGCSMVIDHEGNVAAQAPYGVDAENIVHVKVNPVPRPARGTGWVDHWR